MADSQTAVYKFVLPEVGASDDTWGTKLNADLSKLETLLVSAFSGGTETVLGTSLQFGGFRFGVDTVNHIRYTSSNFICSVNTGTFQYLIGAFDSAPVAQVIAGGTAMTSNIDIVTREKGDARYVNLTGGPSNALLGTLHTRPGEVSHWYLDNDGAASTAYDINPINPSDASSMSLRIGRSSPAGNISFIILNPGTTTPRVVLRSNDTGSVEAGVGILGDWYVGGTPTGAVASNTLSTATGVQLNLRSGLATGNIIVARDSANAVLGIFEISGTAATNINTVMTRQKGDARYLQLSGGLLSGTLDILTDFNPAIDQNATRMSGSGISTQAHSSNSATQPWIHFYYGTTNTFRVLRNGNVQNANNAYGAISDERLKRDITDATPKLRKLMTLRLINYFLKDDASNTKLLGLSAQELQKVFPGLVEVSEDEYETVPAEHRTIPAVYRTVTDDDGNEREELVSEERQELVREAHEVLVRKGGILSIKYSVLSLMMLKGLQELAEFVGFPDDGEPAT